MIALLESTQTATSQSQHNGDQGRSYRIRKNAFAYTFELKLWDLYTVKAGVLDSNTMENIFLLDFINTC